MTSSQKTFISMLRSFVSSAEFVPEENADWNEVIQIAVRQSLAGLMYYVLANVAEKSRFLSDEQTAFLKNAYLQTITRSTQLKYAAEELCKALSAEQIVHVPLKGLITREYYPLPELRTMGDMDFLIHVEDRVTAQKALIKIGYEYIHTEGIEDESDVYKKDDIQIELHTELVYIRAKDNETRLPMPLEWSEFIESEVGEYTLRPTENYFMVLQIAHMAKHFRNTGCGFRYILDIALMLPHYDKWNNKQISTKLEDFRYLKFYEIIVSYCVHKLEVRLEKPPMVLDEATIDVLAREFFVEYVHGSIDKKLADISVKTSRTFKNRRMAKLHLAFSRIFLSLSKMQKEYTYLKKHSWLILIAYIQRMFKLIMNKEIRIEKLKKLNAINDAGILEVNTQRVELIEKLFEEKG